MGLDRFGTIVVVLFILGVLGVFGIFVHTDQKRQSLETAQRNCVHEWVDLGIDYIGVDFWGADQQARKKLRCSKCGVVKLVAPEQVRWMQSRTKHE